MWVVVTNSLAPRCVILCDQIAGLLHCCIESLRTAAAVYCMTRCRQDSVGED